MRTRPLELRHYHGGDSPARLLSLGEFMNRWRRHSPRRPTAALLLAGMTAATVLAGEPAFAQQAPAVVWTSGYGGNFLTQPAAWYGSPEAARIAENVLLYQRNNGGWPKGKEMAAPLSAAARERLLEEKGRDDTTLDNGATHKQIRYLARVAEATGEERFQRGVLRGIDFLLEAQYPNGGWAQFHPNHRDHNERSSSHNPRGLSAFVTFNDDAMIGALEVLHPAASGAPPFGFVDADRRARAKSALDRAVDLILRLQIRQDGIPTAWSTQYDERTFEPRWGRRFEPMSISANESVGIVRFLMGLEDPDPRVVEAVRGAAEWFERVKVTGYRLEVDPRVISVRGVGGRMVHNGDNRHDVRLVSDPDAPPLWARFYEIATNRPVFASDDDTVRYALKDITVERRSGYEWYGSWPRVLLEEEYPAWLRKHGLNGISRRAGVRRSSGP